jgi:hypothetical protein
VRVWGKQGHRTVRIAAVGAMRVGLDEFSDRETVGGFVEGR